MNITRRKFLKTGALVAAAAPFSPMLTAASSNVYRSGNPDTRQSITWWVLADPHVGYPGYRENILTSVRDVNNLDVDYAIVIGDLFEDDRAFLGQLESEMNEFKHEWTYILGNHDYDKNTGAPVLPATYFTRKTAGIRIIALSDEMLENHSHRTELGKNQDQWFRDVLNEDPDIPTLVFTHHCPVTSHRSVSSFDDWLSNEMANYNIVLWIVDHAHRWKIDKNIDSYGFDRIKVGSICEKYGDRRPCESALLKIEDQGEYTRLNMRFRNHEDRRWLMADGYDNYELEVKTG